MLIYLTFHFTVASVQGEALRYLWLNWLPQMSILIQFMKINPWLRRELNPGLLRERWKLNHLSHESWLIVLKFFYYVYLQWFSSPWHKITKIGQFLTRANLFEYLYIQPHLPSKSRGAIQTNNVQSNYFIKIGLPRGLSFWAVPAATPIESNFTKKRR